jgi:glycosyltransferase involved in cell wall biosynthesis
MEPRRIAVVFDWLVTQAGGERVLEEVLGLFPQADLFSLLDFLPKNQRGFLGGRVVRTSFFQYLPFARSNYRHYLPLMPAAAESIDVSGYDLVISLSHAVAKGVLTGPDQTHVSYIFSPMRYALDLRHSYLKETGNNRGWRGILAHSLLSRLRVWDAVSSQNVDSLATLSHFVGRRIKKAYRREARIIYPPVNIEAFPLQEKKGDYYVTVSRLVPYKRVDAIVEAFRSLSDRPLFVIGDGPERAKIQAKAGPNVKLLGRVSESDVARYLGGARAFLFAAEEDFGIAPLEAQACGTPVIAYGRGGARETILGIDQREPTGLFFDSQTPNAIAEAVLRFESLGPVFNPGGCRRNAERFSATRFRQEFSAYVHDVLKAQGSGVANA